MGKSFQLRMMRADQGGDTLTQKMGQQSARQGSPLLRIGARPKLVEDH